MIGNKLHFKLKGNESFNFRAGWLRKGIKGITEDKYLFTRDDAMDKLGVGSKMVKSIRFWMQAATLTKEINVVGSKRYQELTVELGEIVLNYDPYFEDIFTLWVLHYKIIKNEKMCIAWYLFFNEYYVDEFTREDLQSGLLDRFKKRIGDLPFSESSLKDDCNSVIKTYLSDDTEDKHPENNLICPLSELGLIKAKECNKKTYIKSKPAFETLDRLAVLYVIADNLKGEKTSVDISAILKEPGNAGRVFNLDRVLLNEYLDALRVGGYIEVNRTAGLDVVYVKKRRLEEILREYYK